MCIVEYTLNNQISRYIFKGWREALEFASEYNINYTYLRIYSL